MTAFNTFVDEVRCPFCDTVTTASFEAKLGALEGHTYVLFDVVRHEAVSPHKGQVEPSPEPWASGKRFWAWGFGKCSFCFSYLDVKVGVVEGHFQGVWVWLNRSDSDPDWGYFKTRIVDAGNTYNAALIVLEETGCELSSLRSPMAA